MDSTVATSPMAMLDCGITCASAPAQDGSTPEQERARIRQEVAKYLAEQDDWDLMDANPWFGAE